MQSCLKIKWVQDNLALAISLWAAAERGVITAGFIPGRTEILRASGQVVKVSTPLQLGDNTNLIRHLNNQIRGNFALSAINTHLVLSGVYAGSPLEETEPDLRAARCCIYLLHHTLSQDMMTPVWRCPVEYRQKFEVSSIGFALDANQLDGTEVFWNDFGGLTKYLDLLEYCRQGVASLTESPASAFPMPLASPLETIPDISDPVATTLAATTDPRTSTILATADPRTAILPATADPRTAILPATADPRAAEPVLAGATVAAGPIAAEAAGTRQRLPIGEPLLPSTDADPSPASDSAAAFVSACGVVAPEAMIIAGELYDNYQTWCQETGREALSQRSFGMRLTNLGFDRKRRARGRHWWIGLGLA